MGSMPNELKRPGAPEEQELERKRAELAARETLLADRELELATLNAELMIGERFRARPRFSFQIAFSCG